MARSAGARPTPRPCRPDPSFVAQLIATAQQLPQTRPRRRGAAAEALAAYGARQRKAQQAGRKTRQVV